MKENKEKGRGVLETQMEGSIKKVKRRKSPLAAAATTPQLNTTQKRIYFLITEKYQQPSVCVDSEVTGVFINDL